MFVASHLFAINQPDFQVITVIDKNNELVTGAKVELLGSKHVYYTNIKGECYIPSVLLRQFKLLSIECISYKSMNISTREVSEKITLEFR